MGVVNPQSWAGEAVGGREWYHSKERWWGLSPFHTYYSSISTHLPEILDYSYQWGLRTPNFGEGKAVGVGDGTVRKSVGEFL